MVGFLVSGLSDTAVFCSANAPLLLGFRVAACFGGFHWLYILLYRFIQSEPTEPQGQPRSFLGANPTTYPGAGTRLGPVKFPVSGPSGRFLHRKHSIQVIALICPQKSITGKTVNIPSAIITHTMLACPDTRLFCNACVETFFGFKLIPICAINVCHFFS